VVAIAQLAGVLCLLPDVGHVAENGVAAQVQSGVHAYVDIWNAGLILFGVHLVLLGVLVRRAVYAPTILVVMLVIAGLGYAVDGFGGVLFTGDGTNVATYTFVGEVVLIFWLLLRGRRITPATLAKRGGVLADPAAAD
jgi:hypothetical protein